MLLNQKVPKPWRSKSADREVAEKNKHAVWVSIAQAENFSYYHFVMPVESNMWLNESLLTFPSHLPRTMILNNIKTFFNRVSSNSLVQFSDLNEVKIKGNPGFERYLDRVEKLPNHLQAVTVMLRLLDSNPHQYSFGKNLEVARRHFKQWETVDPDDTESSEMYLEPIAGQWGRETWDAITEVTGKFSMTYSALKTKLIKLLENEEARKIFTFLGSIPKDLFITYPRKEDTLRDLLSNPLEENDLVLGKDGFFSDNYWITVLPLEDEEFRTAILDLTFEKIRTLASAGQYLEVPTRIWTFNAKSILYDKVAFEVRLTEKLAAKLGEGPAEDFRDWFNGYAAPFSWRIGLHKLFEAYVDELEDTAEALEEFQDFVNLFWSEHKWNPEGDFTTYFFFSELVRVTGSVRGGVHMVLDATKQELSLSTSDWLAIIDNYDQVRGMDLSIAATLLSD